jgi:hypothetical protein
VTARNATLTLGTRETIPLPMRHVTILGAALRALGTPAGDDVADELDMLARAGIRVDLNPTPGVLGALVAALIEIERKMPGRDATFARVLRLAREQQG